MTELINSTLATETNRFISGFFLPQLPNLQSLNEVAAEIMFERTSWQNSGAAEQYLEELINIYERNGVNHPFYNPRVRIQQLAQIRNTVYGNLESSSKTQKAASKIFGNFPPPYEKTAQ